MELKERNNPGSWDNGAGEWATPEDDIEPLEPAPVQADTGLTLSSGRLAEATFLPDEVYLTLYHQDQAERAEAVARAQAKAAAAKVAAPPSPRPVSHGNGNGQANGNGNGNGSANGRNGAGAGRSHRPSNSKSELIVPDEFKGDYFTPIEVSAMPPVHYEVVRDLESLEKVVEKLLAYPVLAVDTETNGLDPYDSKLILVQVATPDMCYIVDAQKVPLEPLRRVLESPRSLKLLQNAKFDYEMLKQQAGIEVVNLYDTMLAERLLTAGLGAEVGLAALTKRYLGEVMDKSVRKTFYGSSSSTTYMSPEQLNYAAKDALALFPIYSMQLEKLKKEKLLTVADLEFQCVAAVGDLELAGCKLDTVKWRQILAGVEIKRDQARIELMEMLPSGNARQSSMFGSDEYLINLNSGLQIIAEFGRMGIVLEDTSEGTLNKHNHPAIKKLLEYRGHEKTLGAFGEGLLALIHKTTGRIHPDFLQYGADTGRFSCKDPNVQQIPATSDFRACFVPAEGYKLVTSDYSQCIARDSWVATAHGFVRIQAHGDAISRGIAATVRIKTGQGYELECTGDHRLLTRRGWVEARKLEAGDYLALQGQTQFEPVPLDQQSWLSGYWVGTGAATFNDLPGSVSFADGLRALFNPIEAGLPLDRIEQLPSFFCGLFDAGGRVDPNGLDFSTPFEKVARDVQTALLRFGIVSRFSSEQARDAFGESGCNSYRVEITDRVSLENYARSIGFRFTAKRQKLEQIIAYVRPGEVNHNPVLAGVGSSISLEASTVTRSANFSSPFYRPGEVSRRPVSGPVAEFDTRYQWDRLEKVGSSGRQVEVFDLLDQPENRFIAAGFVVHNCELRVLAQLSQDQGFLNAFNSGGDLHILAASQMFNVPPDQVSKSQRSQAKAINFGLAYGMGAQGLAVRIDKTVEESRELIGAYFKAFSGVAQWLERMGRDSIKQGFSPTPLGRKRYYRVPERDDPEYRRKMSEIERRGKNAPIQGCVSGDTRIFEKERGYVPIASLQGQLVTVWDGTAYSEAAVVYSGKKQLVQVELWGGHYIECSPDHRFLTRDASGQEVWKTPTAFEAPDCVVLTEGLDEWACRAGFAALSDHSSRPDGEAMRLGERLGRLASECMHLNPETWLYVAEQEPALLPQLVGVGVSQSSGFVEAGLRLTPLVSSHERATHFQAATLTERVPDCAWQDSRILAGYLRGMFGSDRAVQPDGALLTFGPGQEPLKWAREIQQALLLFGVRSRLKVYSYQTTLQVFRADLTLLAEKLSFGNFSKQAKAAGSIMSQATSPHSTKIAQVKSVEITDEWVDMYDVVNSQTERFMANGLVVHNCNADMTKMALVYLRESLRAGNYDARVVNTVHDEIVVEVRQDQADEVCHLVEAEMIRAGAEILKDVPVVADAKVGDYWSK